MEYLKSNIWEIKKSGSLKTLGALLALFHILQFYLWWDDGDLPLKLVQQGMPMCWTLFENCDWMRAVPIQVLTGVYFAYAVFMALAALILLISDFVTLGFYFMMLGTLCGIALYFQDLRLSSNEGYFIFFMTFCYLWIPSKHRLMRWMIVSFFAAKGLSQATPDWLSGNWYREQLEVPIKLAEWFAALNVLVQMLGSVALLFRDARFFWTGWILLFVFQCTHLYMGELLATSTGLGALLYIVFDEFEFRKQEREYIYQSFIRPEPSFVLGGTIVVLFWLAQFGPFLHLPPGSKIKRTLDVWAVHPDAAQEDCEQRTFAVYRNRLEQIEVAPQMSRQPAMACNVYIRFLDLKGLCNQLQSSNPDFVTLSSVMDVRNFRDNRTFRAFEVKDFCSPNLTFNKLSESRWTMTADR